MQGTRHRQLPHRPGDLQTSGAGLNLRAPPDLLSAESAHLAGDRFHLWIGVKAGDRIGDRAVVPVGPGLRRGRRSLSPISRRQSRVPQLIGDSMAAIWQNPCVYRVF
jgi:hypothetical protein